MNLIRKFKSQKYSKFHYLKKNSFITLLISMVFIILIIINFHLLILNKKSIRNLTSYDNNNVNTSSQEKEEKDVFPVIIFVSYIISTLMSLYMMIMMKVISEKAESVTLQVLKFMYMSNNGYFIASLITIPLTNNNIIIPITVISSLVLLVGTIIFIVKYIKVIIVGFFDNYFGCEIIKFWFGLPFVYVWPFIELTDPCCYSNTYTVTVYSDGTVTDNKCFVICMNRTIWCIKRFAFIFSTLLYYFFLFMLLIVWLIIKLILVIIEKISDSCCKKTENNPNQENQQNQENINNIQFGGINENYQTNTNVNVNSNLKKRKTYVAKNSYITPSSNNPQTTTTMRRLNTTRNIKMNQSLNLHSNINVNQNLHDNINLNNNNMMNRSIKVINTNSNLKLNTNEDDNIYKGKNSYNINNKIEDKKSEQENDMNVIKDKPRNEESITIKDNNNITNNMGSRNEMNLNYGQNYYMGNNPYPQYPQ